jgi:hypothetical protein
MKRMRAETSCPTLTEHCQAGLTHGIGRAQVLDQAVRVKLLHPLTRHLVLHGPQTHVRLMRLSAALVVLSVDAASATDQGRRSSAFHGVLRADFRRRWDDRSRAGAPGPAISVWRPRPRPADCRTVSLQHLREDLQPRPKANSYSSVFVATSRSTRGRCRSADSLWATRRGVRDFEVMVARFVAAFAAV